MSSGIALSGERLAGFAVARATVAANQTTTATSSGTATALMTIGPAQYLGGDYIVELACIGLTKGTTNLDVELWVDGVFSQSITGHLTANTGVPYLTRSKVTLTPGVHTLTLRGFVDAGTGTLLAGTGATGQNPNAIASVYPA